MPTFKDSAGREWQLKLDAPLIRAVRQDCDGLDLVGLEGEALSRLIDDPCLLVDVLSVICRYQFAETLVGDAIERATAAMLESIADFFQRRAASRQGVLRALTRLSGAISLPAPAESLPTV